MQENKFLFHTIIFVLVLGILGGCSLSTTNYADATATPVATPPNLVEDTNNPTRNTSTMPPPTQTPNTTATSTTRATIEAKPTLMATLFETTPTVEPQEILTTDTQSGRVCKLPPSRFDIQGTLGVYNFSSLHFLDEETLVFRGWAPRPAPKITAETTTTSPPAIEEIPVLGEFVSARLLFGEGEVNLLTGDIISNTVDFGSLLNNPCDINCPLEILGVSPNQEWQLIQVSDAGESQIGFWLVSKNQIVRLIEYVPSSSSWQWDETGSLLWFVFATEEHGADALVIQLDNPISIIHSGQGKDNPLDATYNYLAYSPYDKTVASTNNPYEQGLPDKDEIYIFDLTQDTPKLIETRLVPGITNVVWNEATQSYLVSVVQENETEIRTLEGEILVRIPGYQMPSLKFALSSSGKQLAIGYGAVDGIVLFTCD